MIQYISFGDTGKSAYIYMYILYVLSIYVYIYIYIYIYINSVKGHAFFSAKYEASVGPLQRIIPH